MYSIKEELLKRRNGNDEIEDENEMTWKVKVKKKKNFGKFFFFFVTDIGWEDLRKDEYFEKFGRWYN